MKKIDLQDFYPLYHNDLFVGISNEVVAALTKAERIKRSYIHRMYWNKAYFSLNVRGGVGHEAPFVTLSPCKLYKRKATAQKLHAVLNALPNTRGRGVYVHYILGLSKAKIAWVEGVAKSRVSESIRRGLRNMERFLENTFWQAEQSLRKSHGY